ncbi:MAG: DUF4157 domain-containing protein, partial [Deltaproteobacteria bacterium]|nr:DUF4157 domain-containing protein [Deltaproteobacteria bacterium]
MRADLRCHLDAAKAAAPHAFPRPDGREAATDLLGLIVEAQPYVEDSQPVVGHSNVEGDQQRDSDRIAARGVEGGGQQLPHYDIVQRLFGSHDISHVRAHVGGPAAEATRQLGAQAYARGDHIAFSGQPTLGLVAHEAAHVVQQRSGVASKNSEPGDEFERHADAVADAVVHGQSAEPLLSTMAGTGATAAPARPVVQRKEADAAQADAFAPSKAFARYVEIHSVDLGKAVAKQLRNTIWPDPTEDTPFTRTGERRFSETLTDLIREQLARPEHLVMMLYPGNALERFQQYVVAPGQLHNLSYKGFGEPLAQLVELAAKESLTKRVGPRYAQLLSQMVRMPTADDIIAGHPIDPLVATAVCEPGILEANVATTKDIGPPKLQDVQARWLGRQNPELWNFVQVTPATATAEEVAATLWGDHKKTTMAFAIEKFGDLFRIAPAYARQVLAGRYPNEPVGSSDVDASRAKQMVAVAKSSLRHGEAPAAEFGHQNQTQPVSAEQVADIETHIGTLLDQIGAQLARVALDKLLQPAYAAKRERTPILASADASTRAHWLPVLSFQHTQLLTISARLPSVVQAYQKVFVVLPFGDTERRREHDDLQLVVTDYAAAAGTSHLRDESTAIMRRIEQRQKLGAQNQLDASAVELHDATQTNVETGGRSMRGNTDADTDIEHQRQIAQNRGKTSQYDRRKAQIAAGEHALLARMDSAERSLLQLQEAADAAGFADGEALRKIIPNAKTLPEIITDVRDHLSDVNRTWDKAIAENTPEVQEEGSPDGWADWQAREAALPLARTSFAKIAGDQPLGDFIRKAIKEIRVQQIVNALVTLAEALLLTVVAGAGAAAIARAAASLVAEADTLVFAGVEIAANASLNSLVQMAVSGDGNASFGWTMLENGLMDIFTRGLLGPMKRAEQAARIEVQEIAALPHLTDAERRAASTASFMGAQPIAELVGGMASQWAARHIVDMAKSKAGSGGAHGEGASDSFALTALQQGAAIGLGKFFHGRLEAWKSHRKQLEQTRFGSLPEARALFAAREEFFNDAARLEASPSPDPSEAERLNERNVELLKQERALLETHGRSDGASHYQDAIEGHGSTQTAEQRTPVEDPKAAKLPDKAQHSVAPKSEPRYSYNELTVGVPPKEWNAQKEWLSDENHWLPERQQLHRELLERARAEAGKFAEAMMGKGEPTLYAMRGNTASGKTRLAKSGAMPEIEAAVRATGDGRSINPDNFKGELMRHGGFTANEVHMEASVLADKLQNDMQSHRTADGKPGSMIVDKRLLGLDEIESYAKLAKESGRKFVMSDVDTALENSLVGVLGRKVGGNDPLVPHDPVAEGFKGARRNRADVIAWFQSHPDASYTLYGTTSDGAKVEVAQVRGGKLTIKNAAMYDELTAKPGSETEVTSGTIITQALIDEIVGRIADPKYATQVANDLRPH